MEWLLSWVLALMGLGMPVPDKVTRNLPPIRQDANGTWSVYDLPGYDGTPLQQDRAIRGESTNLPPVHTCEVNFTGECARMCRDTGQQYSWCP